MLYEAFFWNPNNRRPKLSEFLNNPDFQKHLKDWGREGDIAVIAEANGTPIGAAWYRFWSTDNHSYGFIDPATPELGIAVIFGYRSKGVGRRLLQKLMDVARLHNARSMSLSVDPHNFALRLYESEEFVKVGESGTSWTMMRKLTNP
jgi:GNAT superfamily N-acetyltransferase